MRQRFVWLAAILLFASVAHAEEPQKYALLVGVTKYRHSRMNDAPLKYPEADAAAIGEMLKASGYAVEILLGEKATQQAVQAALAKAGRQGNTGGVLVVGLFGHGVQYGEDAYFGPYDTTVREVTDAQGNALRKNGQIMLEPDPASMVDMKSILDALTKCGASHKVILADCCREDPSTARGRAFGSQLRVADLPSGTAALFACSANEQAFEHDDWGHGAFSKALLDHAPRMAADEGVTANELSVALYRTVSLLVRDKTSGSKRQTVNPIINGVVDLRLVTDGPEYLVGSRAGELREFSDLKIKFCWCPPGEFEFRAERIGGLRRAEGSFPTRKITPASNSVRLTRGFWLSTFEVNISEFVSVLPQHRSQKLAVEPDGDFPKNGDPASLVANVTWREAADFCRELTLRERIAGRLAASEEYTLPTVAQWQYAVHGGAATTYFFGDDLSDSDLYCTPWAWPHDRRGTKKPNHWGLYDLIGSQQEWCQDWLPDTQWPSGDDPVVPLRSAYTRTFNDVQTRYHVLAGGHYGFSVGDSNAANQELLKLEVTGAVFEGGTEDCPYYGFRIARTRVR